ncbi:hypothetical protein [Nocardioides sp. LS1]|uniref:hypothetical protein n=1 Tax=Nocardioides sp. LS1 TaxID=1027620 RepID=UPI000F617FB7|nr:hypothetical protein [Nocardioides sp. LS1]GCD90184.1 hypothetical protein NLS1_21900 [Nocardioides sp. LS1]
MSDDPSLFGDDAPGVPSEPVNAPWPITDWQVDLLRRALDARGLTSMAERQQAIECVAGRAVESLRALSHDEARNVLASLAQQPSAGRSQTSAWDDRDEETWIDRL